LEPEFLGGKHWTTSDGMPALPYRRCIREARFKGSLPIPEGAPKSRIELSGGGKTITVEVDALRAATRCWLYESERGFWSNEVPEPTERCD
jgi:hypothetical protein